MVAMTRINPTNMGYMAKDDGMKFYLHTRQGTYERGSKRAYGSLNRDIAEVYQQREINKKGQGDFIAVGAKKMTDPTESGARPPHLMSTLLETFMKEKVGQGPPTLTSKSKAEQDRDEAAKIFPLLARPKEAPLKMDAAMGKLEQRMDFGPRTASVPTPPWKRPFAIVNRHQSQPALSALLCA